MNTLRYLFHTSLHPGAPLAWRDHGVQQRGPWYPWLLKDWSKSSCLTDERGEVVWSGDVRRFGDGTLLIVKAASAGCIALVNGDEVALRPALITRTRHIGNLYEHRALAPAPFPAPEN